MCTLSWKCSSSGLTIWFNRDEQRSRPPARPPARFHTGTTDCLHPTDPQGGGTWLMVNTPGMVACLTNHYEAETSFPTERISRGTLVLALRDSASEDALTARLHREVQDQSFAPFHLWTASLLSPPALWQWDGTTLRQLELSRLPIHTTSSYRSEEVAETRRQKFAQQVGTEGTPQAHEAFHRQHDPAYPAHSVWMEREDAWTVSLTRVVLTEKQAVMTYQDRQSAAVTAELPLQISRKP